MVSKVFCPIRCEWVSALPEEKVRQRLLAYMIQKLGYPKGYLIVEKGLNQLPHLANSGIAIPERRTDIVCVTSGIHPDYELHPLLVVECKSVKLSDKAFRQAVGYNRYLDAPFIAIANDHEIRTGWYDQAGREYQFVSFLPEYQELASRALSTPRERSRRLAQEY
ncbi:MAG: type I restriction enzyme HsdR N-terminal domain-containing protein [Chlamydiales bacterium]|nr:type I restriction enzyme HsdR N-terminal domain-containing protein [Chlamydiia bacterium]MCP5506989.1 type I restriction enzyme HsdR N-terminal domain-containing protein [Chlamydiales bacterium]